MRWGRGGVYCAQATSRGRGTTMATIILTIVGIGIQIVIAIGTIAVSYYILRKEIDANRQIAQEFGDMAGTLAAIEYEEEKDAKAQIIALQALLNETERIRETAERNSQLNPQGHPVPVAPFSC